MLEQFLDPLKELNYANLSQQQENKLRDIEKQFNNEFDTDVYFMVMKK